MCELNAYVLDNGEEELVMEDVAVIKPEAGDVILSDIMGRQKKIPGTIGEVRVMEHKIYLHRPE